MTDVISSLTSAFTLAFVVTSMFGLGLGLTVQQILEPLKNVRLVIASLLANFLIVPAAAFALTRVFSLDPDLAIGVILLSTVAGAPLALKAAQIARGDIQFSVSLVTLQVVATVIYLPLVLPWLVPGVQVDTVAIASSLVLQVLLPLAFGLLMNARYDEEAEMARPIMGEISNISLAVMIVLNLTNIGSVLGLIGTGAILASLLVISTGFVSGYILGGPDGRTRKTLSVGTGHRNYAAAFVIAAGNLADRPNVILLLLAAAMINTIATMLVAGEMGNRAKARVRAESPVTPLPSRNERSTRRSA